MNNKVVLYSSRVEQLILNESNIIIHIINERFEQSHTIYNFDKKLLKETDYLAIDKYNRGTHNLYLYVKADMEKGLKVEHFFKLAVEEKLQIEIFEPKKLNEIVPIDLDYVPLKFGLDDTLYVQTDGFHVIVAPTGSGKTYNAIKNLPTLCKKFDIVLYLHLELSESDVYNRFNQMHKVMPDNLMIGQTTNIDDLIEFVGDRKACIILDNIDNLIGAGEGAYDVQLEFVLKFDRWAKETGNMGIFLTQFVKEGREKILVKDKISDDISINQLSGVKQISNMSRSVIMTYYDGKTNYTKVLKKGSGKYEYELIGAKESRTTR